MSPRSSRAISSVQAPAAEPTSRSRRALFVAVMTVAAAPPAHAGGMFLPFRGVHAVEQAGAVVAGAQDADALFDNPAGLAHITGGLAMVVDGAFVAQSVDYTRIDSGGTTLAPVSSDYPGIVAPTIAVAYPVNDRLVLAGGIDAPYAGLGRYPVGGPERYATVSMAESLFVTVSVGVAYAVTPELRVGVTVQDVVSKVASRVTLGGCPAQTVCAPEDPDFDADTKLTQTDLFAPSASAGIQWDASRYLTLGATAQAPSRVSANGELQTKVPSASFFDGASVRGNSATLALTIPAMFKAGVAVHPTPHLTIEAALDVELWSEHADITITPHDTAIVNAAGVGTYQLGEVIIPRHYRNSYAPSVGGQYRQGRWQVGAGYSYETAAAPAAYVSVLTVDSAKNIFGLGGGFDLHGYQLSAALGYVAMRDVSVSLADAKVTQLSPIRDQGGAIDVNAGGYRTHYVLAGLRLAKKF